MAPHLHTMTEKETFLAHQEREHRTTIKVLRAFPPEEASFKPHPTSMTALETAWMMAAMLSDPDSIAGDEMKMEGEPPPTPKSWEELTTQYEKSYAAFVRKVQSMSDDELNGSIRVPMAKDRTEPQRRQDVLWYFLHAMIHHRGQLSVYLRMVGGKVPSIYGPSGDEPW